MKQSIFAGMLVLLATAAQAQDTGLSSYNHPQQAYTTLGPAGAGVYRTTITQRDNFSTTGKVNPRNGAVAPRKPRY